MTKILTPLQEELLRGKSPEDLSNEFGLRVYEHPNLPLVGFKYNQIDSPKTHPVVRWSRGTVLEAGTWNLVAQPFKRFFNLGEHLEESSNFNWNEFSSTSKEDGSLVILYHYDGDWHVNTSGSFAKSDLCLCHGTWEAMFWHSVPSIKKHKLDKGFTYLFEMCTPCNQVVRLYDKPQSILIGAIVNETLLDFGTSALFNLAQMIDVPLVDFHDHKSLDCVTSFIKGKEESDPSFEGLVVRDSNNMRLKIKSSTYLSLHRMADNGNISSEKSLVPWILAGECDELLTYFPSLEQKVEDVSSIMEENFSALVEAWENAKHIESQKEFAQAIVPATKFNGILFRLRQNVGADADESDLKKIWRDSEELIVKVLFKK